MSHWVSCERVPSGRCSDRVTRSSREPGDVGRPRTGSRRDHANERSVDLDVTTSLRPSAAELRGRGKYSCPHCRRPSRCTPTTACRGRPGSGPCPGSPPGTVPTRVLLVVLDFAATALASFTAISLFEQADSGFKPRSPQLFTLVAYVGLPLGWLIMLWGHGAYDRRYLGVGADEFKRMFRASITAAATRLVPGLRPQVRPVPALGRHRAASASLVYIMFGRWLARRLLVLHPRPGPGGAPGAARRHASPRRPTSTRPSPGCPAPAWSRSASTSPRGTRQSRGTDLAGAGLRRPRRADAGPRPRRRHDRRLRLGPLRAGRAAPAGLAARGHRHRPGRRARSSPTSPAPGCTSARSRACRCCTSRSPSSPAWRGCSRT